MICNACGYENNEDGQYCSQCGLPLAIEEDDFPEDAPRPRLSKVVPYVIPGQETGYIPTLDAEEPADESESSDAAESEDVADVEASDDVEAQVGDADREPSDALEETAASEDEASNREAEQVADGDDSAESCQSDSEPEEPGEAQADSSSAEDAGSAEADSAEESNENERTQRIAEVPEEGMASWDREFPTSKNTAVMPEIVKEDAADESCQQADADKGEAAAEDGPDCEGDKLVGDEADQADADSAEGADAPDDEVEESDSSGDEADDQDEDDSDQDDEGNEDDDDAPLGKHARHAASKDISDAKTEKLDRVPDDNPFKTAVVPSIAVSGPRKYSAADKKDEGRRELPKQAMVIAAVIALLAIIVMLFGARSCMSGAQIPNIVGLPSQEARARLDAAGFEVQVESKIVEDSKTGTVLECEPKAGSKHKKGSTVVITVSASQTIPDVVGVDLDTAQTMLKEQGAENVKVVAEASNQPENTVIAVSPEVDKPFSPDGEVTLTVATSATLPDVVGMNEEAAVSTLEEAGYKTSVKWEDAEEESGTVLSTDPEPDSLANLGSKVTLTVASPGPSDFMKIMEYHSISPESNSEYLSWKGFTVDGSYKYNDDWSGGEFVSQIWKAKDGTTVSFTPAPYIEDKGLDMVDYMSQGVPFQGVRIFIPASSNLSLGKEVSMTNLKKYMDACGLENLADSCTKADVDYNGVKGDQLGVDEFVCAQGEMNGKVWTILLTEDGAYIGTGGYECYSDMSPLCDSVAVNEIFSKNTQQ